ncbi:FAM13A-like protein [Labeo rohita]|uniref:FAM13A-like protein n=1 Tax=Labeo rohita TaxID=84645 RepID=A0A498LSX5_LABRO|nr:FAM13A-like protein [Labeo rohita]
MSLLFAAGLIKVETPRAMFGVPLVSLRKSGQMRQGLPLVFTHIVEFVEKHGLSKSGLFRVPGSVKRCQDLRKSFDEGSFPEFEYRDILTVGSLLKAFLRELPGGLIPEPQRTQLLKVFKASKEEELNQAVKTILSSLPEEHFNVLCYLMFFLSRVAAESHLNLMTSENLSIVFGPNIFPPTMVEEQGQCNDLTKYLLENLIHLLPNIYPHASTSSTADEGDWTTEECVELLPLIKISSNLPKLGRVGRLRKRMRGFWRKLFSCTSSYDIKSAEASLGIETQM